MTIIKKTVDLKNLPKMSKVNKVRFDAIKDEDIDYSDIPELDEEFWKGTKLVTPIQKEKITVRFDADVVEWFRSQGRGYQTRMNSVLKSPIGDL